MSGEWDYHQHCVMNTVHSGMVNKSQPLNRQSVDVATTSLNINAESRAAVNRARILLQGQVAENLLHAAAWRITVRSRLLDLMLDLNRLRGEVLDLAGNHAAQADRLARDYERLLGALERVDRCPVVTDQPADAPIACVSLGFAQPMEVADAATATSDDVQESVAVCAVVLNGLLRLVPAAGVRLRGIVNEVNRALADVLADNTGEAESAVLVALARTRAAVNEVNLALSGQAKGDDRPDMTRRRRLRLGKDRDALAVLTRRMEINLR